MTPVEFLKSARAGDTTMPPAAVQTQISQVLDRTYQQIVLRYEDVLANSQDIKRCIAHLNQQPRVTGPYDASKVLFRGYSPFEQFYILDQALKVRHYREKHTFRFAVGEDDSILVQVSKIKHKQPGLMNCILGSGKNAPKYEDWPENDPQRNPAQRVFIAPLLQLENMRAKNQTASSTIKSILHMNELIDQEVRYGKEFACVEFTNQSNRKHDDAKQQSAGKVFSHVVEEFVDSEAPGREEVPMNPGAEYDQFFQEGDFDDLRAVVAPSDLVEGLIKHYESGDDSELRQRLENLFISTVGPVHEPRLQQHLVARLEANAKDTY